MRTAILGGAGGMGRFLVKHFLEQNHSVVISDPRHIEISGVEKASNNKDAVIDSDLILISVPMEDTSQVIREVIPNLKRDSILCEISTLKSNVVENLRYAASRHIRPLSIHPLFGPSVDNLTKKFALIPIIDSQREEQLLEMLFPGSRIIVVDAENHDRIMALTLSLPYFTNMILAAVLKDEDISLLEELSGTTFAVQFMLTASIMSHTSHFHSSLLSENTYTLEVLEKFLSISKDELTRLTRDFDEFKKSYLEVKSVLEEKISLDEKYREMYRVLEVMEKEIGLNS
jgi:prephenate dehydrogenase